MSLLSNLQPADGSVHYRKRLGRGRGSGLGQTSGKGHKGQLARTGGRVRRGFEGGQTPIMRRLPKYGFTNAKFRTHYSIVNLGQLNSLSGEVSVDTLVNSGLVPAGTLVKVLSGGELKAKLNLKINKISATAKVAIEALGGSVEVVK